MEQILNQIFCGDARHMDKIPNEFVDLIVTSPPYNGKVEYDLHNDDLPLEEYLQLLLDVWTECKRVLKKGGRICINVANVGRKPYIHLSGLISQQLISLDFLLRGEIIWLKGMTHSGGTNWGSWLSPSNPVSHDQHEYIIVASKDQYNIEEKGETDLTSAEFLKWVQGEWTFQPINHYDKKGHPAPFPVELPFRCIKLLSWIGAVVLDPFMGTGTTGVAAKRLNRKYVGYDISPTYCKIAREQCSQNLITKYLNR